MPGDAPSSIPPRLSTAKPHSAPDLTATISLVSSGPANLTDAGLTEDYMKHIIFRKNSCTLADGISFYINGTTGSTKISPIHQNSASAFNFGVNEPSLDFRVQTLVVEVDYPTIEPPRGTDPDAGDNSTTSQPPR
ncbi:hypothetical protein BJ085DRAFT_32314 [Dimargaris cristalligena]|uniref:Uncharacterized protein n=1 Tax=Dimargaris cristalligena TaxID=215637 RepID=A0A4Q0A4U4_9FUNG|nr:hypothetical protein BJ085DRAFT_32314 [Dimargaris cristalligena]|eukprot:RKP40270.1 hypothetical protein BJ085DRAFT_32314 [Dimargaris cristalligena]